MARRRSDDAFAVMWDIFMTTPWWVCPIVAGFAFLLLYVIIPVEFNTNPTLKVFSSTSQTFAPFVAVVLLFMGLVATAKKWMSGLLLDRQKGLDTIQNLSWREFEELIGEAFRRQGYRVTETGGGGADGGIDLILVRDGQKSLVQCKHWKSDKVGVKLVRELHGLTHSREHAGSRGIFVTFGEYTPDAIKFSQDNGIELISKKTLEEMIRSAQSARSAQPIQQAPPTQPASQTYQSAAITESSPAPICPKCGAKMVLRTARKGERAGKSFWGCPSYPKCSAIVNC